MTEPSTNQSTAQPASDRPPPPHLSSHALLGSASPMLRDPLGFLLETRRYGEVVGMRFVFSQAYLAYHPDDVSMLLQENHINYNKDVFTYHRILRRCLEWDSSSRMTATPGCTSGADATRFSSSGWMPTRR